LAISKSEWRSAIDVEGATLIREALSFVIPIRAAERTLLFAGRVGSRRKRVIAD